MKTTKYLSIAIAVTSGLLLITASRLLATNSDKQHAQHCWELSYIGWQESSKVIRGIKDNDEKAAVTANVVAGQVLDEYKNECTGTVKPSDPRIDQ